MLKSQDTGAVTEKSNKVHLLKGGLWRMTGLYLNVTISLTNTETMFNSWLKRLKMAAVICKKKSAQKHNAKINN